MVLTKPTKLNAIEDRIIETKRGNRLSNRDNNHPAIGRPASELKGRVSKTFPSSASLKLNNSLIFGIMEAQVDKENPERKKERLRAMRYLRKGLMLNIFMIITTDNSYILQELKIL